MRTSLGSATANNRNRFIHRWEKPMTPSRISVPAGLVTERRSFFRAAGAATLSATAVALMAGCESMAQGSNMNSSSMMAADVNILNVALGLEHEAINAYQLGAESGL